MTMPKQETTQAPIFWEHDAIICGLLRKSWTEPDSPRRTDAGRLRLPNYFRRSRRSSGASCCRCCRRRARLPIGGLSRHRHRCLFHHCDGNHGRRCRRQCRRLVLLGAWPLKSSPILAGHFGIKSASFSSHPNRTYGRLVCNVVTVLVSCSFRLQLRSSVCSLQSPNREDTLGHTRCDENFLSFSDVGLS